MPSTDHEIQGAAVVTTQDGAASVEHPPAPKPELREEIRRIVERNWKRDEEALRYLGR